MVKVFLKFVNRIMEITNDLEVRLIVTARKIKMCNEHIAQLKQYNALSNIPETERVRAELEREFQWLSEQVRAVETISA